MCRRGELLLGPVGEGRPGHCGGGRRRLDVLHEGGVLLEEGWGYCGWVGSSCSTHNHWPVDPDPRGVDRLGAGAGQSRLGAGRTGVELCPPGLTQGAGGGGGPVAEAPGCATKNPGLAPARPGVHSADMNEPAAKAPSGNRWNAAVLPRRAAPMRL